MRRLQRIVIVLLLLALVMPMTVLGHDFSTACKWDFPWPRQVEYWIDISSSGDFTAEEATRVSYGPATWSEGNFNLHFQRVWSLADSEGDNTFIARGPLMDPAGNVAEAYLSPSLSCNRMVGIPLHRPESSSIKPITGVSTVLRTIQTA